jgi:preprotein translocase subunit SecG
MSLHLHSKIHDIIAVVLGPGLAALITATTLEAWLKVVVLILTIIFIGLGIAMRVMKIRKAADEEEEG